MAEHERYGYSSISQEAHPPSSSLRHTVTIPIGPKGKLFIPLDGRYSYSYGPSGFWGLWNNRYTLTCGILASVGGVSFGYDQGVIANVLVMPQFIEDFGMTPFQMGLITAILELGALLGALLSGTFADKFTRSQAIFFACLLAFIGSLLQSLSPPHTLGYLASGRLVAGMGVGALSTLAPLYISEISPPETRGSLVSLEQLSIVVGVVAGFWIGFSTRNFEASSSWRTPLFLQLVPAVVLGVGCVMLPPSPRLLVLQGKVDEAKLALLMLRRTPHEESNETLIEVELLEMEVEATLISRVICSTDPQPQYTWADKEIAAWRKLFQPKNRQRAWIGILMMLFQQWSGINALLYFGPSLVQSIGVGDPSDPHPTSNLIVAGGIGIVQMLAVFPAILVVDLWGRKPLLRLGSVSMGCSHLIVAVLILLFEGSWPSHKWAAWVAVGAMYVFTLSYGLSFGPIGWLLPSEIFPLSLRSKGVALSVMSNWSNNFIIGLVTPAMVEFSAFLTFLIFSLSCTIAYLWTSSSYVPETKGVGLEDMDTLFDPGSTGGSERELRAQIEREVGLTSIIEGLVQDGTAT